jgi:hypothetical protein
MRGLSVGRAQRRLDAEPDAAERLLTEAGAGGIDLEAITAELEREGVSAFCDSYRELLDCIEGKLGVVAASSRARLPANADSFAEATGSTQI